jgi:hypothetical protein
MEVGQLVMKLPLLQFQESQWVAQPVDMAVVVADTAPEEEVKMHYSVYLI